MVEVVDALQKLYGDYQKATPRKLKLIDAYLFYILLTGVLQFAYCLLVGTFPFNAFLSGFCSTVASFILAGKWRRVMNGSGNINSSNFSQPPHPSQPREQGALLRHLTRARVRRLHLCSRRAPPGRGQLHRIRSRKRARMRLNIS